MLQIKSFVQDWGLIIVELLIAFGVLTGIATLFTKTFQRLASYRARISFQKVMMAVRFNRSLREETDADRSLICVCTNGTGIPNVKKPVKVSILYEDYRDEGSPIFEDWQRRFLNGQAREVIERIVEDKVYCVDVEKMNNGDLKGVFEEHGVKYAPHYEIHAGPHGYYFLILWFKGKVTNKQKAEISLYLDRFKLIFK